MKTLPQNASVNRVKPWSIMPERGWVGSMLALLVLVALIWQRPALAQDSAVTIYGRVNLGVVHYAGAGRVPITREQNLSSRIGFKGTENLGGGLLASFIIETGIAADTGDAVFGSRETSVGLEGRLGKIKLGYMLTPLDDLHPIAGPGYVTNVTNDNLNGFWANGYSNLLTGGTVGNTACTQVAGPNGNTNSFAFDNRAGNSIRYDTPNWNGWRGATQLALGEVSTCHAWASSNKLQYSNDRLNAALAYQVHHNVRGVGLKDQIVMLAAGYQITPSNYVGGYAQSLEYANPGLAKLKQNGFGLIWRTSLSAANTMEFAWYHAGAGRGNQTPVFSGVFVGPDTKAELFIIGAKHIFSKRTELWMQYATLRNSRRSGYDLGGSLRAGTPETIGAKPQALAFGIKHDF
jgi:predicted porin